MSRVFIIGATGGVGSRLVPMLIKAGHKVAALHRKPEQVSQLESAGITPCLGDIMTMTADDLTDLRRAAMLLFSLQVLRAAGLIAPVRLMVRVL